MRRGSCSILPLIVSLSIHLLRVSVLISSVNCADVHIFGSTEINQPRNQSLSRHHKLRYLASDEGLPTDNQTISTFEHEEVGEKKGFLASASTGVVVTIAVFGFVGGMAIAVLLIFVIFISWRRGCNRSSQSQKEQSHLATTGGIQTPETKRSHTTRPESDSSSPSTSPVSLKILSRRKLPDNLSNPSISGSNPNDVSGSQSIISFLESAGRAYNDLHGDGNDTNNYDNRNMNARRKMNVDIAGMSIDSSTLPRPASSIDRLGGGQNRTYYSSSHNRVEVGDPSLVSVYTISDLYPDEEFEYVHGRG
jgi:hypothetical protein